MIKKYSLIWVMLLLASCGLFGRGDFSKCQIIATQIAGGILKPNPQGIVALPADLTDATVDGNAYVTVRPSGKQWILFRVEQGKGANLVGFLYTAGDNPPIGSSVTITTVVAYTIGPAEVTIDSSMGESWYKVFRTLD
jgi:hypothetical protein